MTAPSLLPSAPARYYDEDWAVHIVGRQPARDLSASAADATTPTAPTASTVPSAPDEKRSWKLRAVVYLISTVLLVAAIGAFGDVVASSRAKLLLDSAPAAEAKAKAPALTHEEYLSAKARIWKRYREQVRQCTRAEAGRQDACFEQARRERKATQAEVKSQIVPLPHSPEDRKVALY